jgi:hypothetical protein
MSDHPDPIASPWVLIDAGTVDQTADLLERLVGWLDDPDNHARAACTRALTLGETDDPVTLASWADALTARLRDRAHDSQLDPNRLTD